MRGIRMKLTRQEILKLAATIMYWGLLIDLVGAALLFVLGHQVRDTGLISRVPAENLRILGYSLIALSGLEIVVVVILKRRWVCKDSAPLATIRRRDVLARQLRLLFIILYLVAFTPSLYGFLYFILGGTEQLFVTMLAITLVGYMLTRIRPDSLEEVVGELDLEDPG